MGHAAVYGNGCIRWIRGNEDQPGLDQAMCQGIDNKPQHTGDDQGAQNQVYQGENIENNFPKQQHDAIIAQVR
jgi:hypothetical protein